MPSWGDDPFAGIFRFGESANNQNRAFNFGVCCGERAARWFDLRGVDERLAGGTHRATSSAFGGKTFAVRAIPIDVIDDIDAVGSAGQYNLRKPHDHVGAVGSLSGPCFLEDTRNETGQADPFLIALGRDVVQVEQALGRLDHCPCGLRTARCFNRDNAMRSRAGLTLGSRIASAPML